MRWSGPAGMSVALGLLLSGRILAQAPEYVPARQVSGTLRVCGSPQMAELLHEYERGFAQVQPGVRFEEQLQSTLTAVAGVAAGSAEVGLLGREIWPKEREAYRAARGHSPLVVDVATGSFDVPKATFALMIFVPRDNPLRSLSIKDLRKVFVRREAGQLRWADLGLTGAWAGRPVHLYGFEVGNDKAQIFARLVFRSGDRWSPELREFGNRGEVDAGERIVEAVAADPDAIGISNVHYATPGVRALALSARGGGPPVAPTLGNVASRRYPLTREVYLVVDPGPDGTLAPALAEFLRFVLGRQGQAAVRREGSYLPLPDAVAKRELAELPER